MCAKKQKWSNLFLVWERYRWSSFLIQFSERMSRETRKTVFFHFSSPFLLDIFFFPKQLKRPREKKRTNKDGGLKNFFLSFFPAPFFVRVWASLIYFLLLSLFCFENCEKERSENRTNKSSSLPTILFQVLSIREAPQSWKVKEITLFFSPSQFMKRPSMKEEENAPRSRAEMLMQSSR